jgi:mono/diheme cytochrome c family protein
MTRTTVALLTAGIVAVTLAASPVAAQTPAAPDGAQLYTRNCASCHGATGAPSAAMLRSMPALPDFSNARTMAALADSTLVNVITNGKGRAMPAYRTRLTPEQVRLIVAHLRTLSRSH